MTQVEKTESVIEHLNATAVNAEDYYEGSNTHARALARKLDAIMNECNYATSTMARCSLPHTIKQIIEAAP